MRKKVMIIDFIIPIFVVLTIFVVAKIAIANYNLKELTKKKITTIIIDKNIRPAGTTPMYRFIGGGVYTIPVSNLEEPTFVVDIAKDRVSGVVDKELYQQKKIGDSVNVEYFEPKFWGSPIIIYFN